MTTENSHEAKRLWRLPRFRLSTILVLVGMLALAMSMRRAVTYDPTPDATEDSLTWRWTAIDKLPAGLHARVLHSWDPSYGYRGAGALRLFIRPHEAIAFVVIVSFLTWKLGWAIVARRKRNASTPFRVTLPAADEQSERTANSSAQHIPD